MTEMPQDWRSIKETLLDRFPKEKAEGLNTGRVEDYIREQGMPVKPYIIFEKDDLPEVKNTIGETKLLEGVFDGGEKGVYLRALDLALVLRERDYEALNGTTYVESNIAHELAHASNMHREYVRTKEGAVYTPRSGFALPLASQHTNAAWGWFLEEGFAHMMQGGYVEKHPEDLMARMKPLIPFEDLSPTDTFPMDTAEGHKVSIPLKYLYIDPEGKVTCGVSAPAGWGVELLCKKAEGLKELLIASHDNVDALREVAKAINGIHPDLYMMLQRSEVGQSAQTNYLDKLNHVIQSVYGGVEQTVSGGERVQALWTK